MSDASKRQVLAAAERVFDADPANVWAMIADPSRVGEWAGVVMVGYMGTELPKVGHNLFVRPLWWRRLARTRRVEIEAWDAGAKVRCRIHDNRWFAPIGFELSVRSEVVDDGIATRVRLVQRMDVAPPIAGVVGWWADQQLRRRMNRIGRAVQK